MRAAFTRIDIGEWSLTPAPAAAGEPATTEADPESPVARPDEPTAPEESSPQIAPTPELATSPPPTGVIDRSLVLVPQYPLSEREVAQAWRRLRRPLRIGPAVEIDLAATIERRSRSAVVTPPVLTPRRRNTAKLLLLIDRYGSMTPYHGYVNHVVRAIQNAGRLDDVRQVFFHDLPTSANPDRSVLDLVRDPFQLDLDSVLPLITPLEDGRVYDDPELITPGQLKSVIADAAPGTAAAVISDAGAARGRLDTIRLLDTVSLLKALTSSMSAVTWLNPAKSANWPESTAGQIARYIPMFPLTRVGLTGAVEALRGRPTPVERPL